MQTSLIYLVVFLVVALLIGSIALLVAFLHNPTQNASSSYTPKLISDFVRPSGYSDPNNTNWSSSDTLSTLSTVVHQNRDSIIVDCHFNMDEPVYHDATLDSEDYLIFPNLTFNLTDLLDGRSAKDVTVLGTVSAKFDAGAAGNYTGVMTLKQDINQITEHEFSASIDFGDTAITPVTQWNFDAAIHITIRL
jgi:hypothetical protein